MNAKLLFNQPLWQTPLLSLLLQAPENVRNEVLKVVSQICLYGIVNVMEGYKLLEETITCLSTVPTENLLIHQCTTLLLLEILLSIQQFFQKQLKFVSTVKDMACNAD